MDVESQKKSIVFLAEGQVAHLHLQYYVMIPDRWSSKMEGRFLSSSQLIVGLLGSVILVPDRPVFFEFLLDQLGRPKQCKASCLVFNFVLILVLYHGLEGLLCVSKILLPFYS